MEQFGIHGKCIKLSSSDANIELNDIAIIKNEQTWSTSYGTIEIDTNMYPKNVVFNWSFKYNHTADTYISIGINSKNNDSLDAFCFDFTFSRSHTFYAWDIDIDTIRTGYKSSSIPIDHTQYGPLSIQMSLDTSTKQLKFTANDKHFSIDNIDITQKYYLGVTTRNCGSVAHTFQITDFFVSI